MRRFLVALILAAGVLCLCCVSGRTEAAPEDGTAEVAPKWITDQGRLEVFPESDFVSQLAYGDSGEDAKARAAAGISGYIESSVRSYASTSYFYKENSAGFSESRELSESVQVATDSTLFNIEYTNPFYHPDLGQYACVAFINRNQAFEYVRPKLDIARNEFPAAYSNAMAKESTLDKIIGIRRAQKTLDGFYEVYDFARAILPSRAKLYEDIDFLAAESFVMRDELASSVLVKIEGVGDLDLLDKSGVVAELTDQLGKIGLVAGNSLQADCLALVEVRSSITETKTTFETYPEISVKLLEKGREKLSYSKRLAKVAGFDRDTVARRTHAALAREIRTSFVDECF